MNALIELNSKLGNITNHTSYGETLRYKFELFTQDSENRINTYKNFPIFNAVDYNEIILDVINSVSGKLLDDGTLTKGYHWRNWRGYTSNNMRKDEKPIGYLLTNIDQLKSAISNIANDDNSDSIVSSYNISELKNSEETKEIAFQLNTDEYGYKLIMNVFVSSTNIEDAPKLVSFYNTLLVCLCTIARCTRAEMIMHLGKVYSHGEADLRLILGNFEMPSDITSLDNLVNADLSKFNVEEKDKNQEFYDYDFTDEELTSNM